MQILNLGHGQFMNVVRSFRDNGKDAERAMVGGQRRRISDAIRARPEISQSEAGFFYKDGTTVTHLSHVDYLPEPYKTEAEKYIKGNQNQEPEPAVFESAEAAKAAATPKRRGRPSTKTEAKKVI